MSNKQNLDSSLADNEVKGLNVPLIISLDILSLSGIGMWIMKDKVAEMTQLSLTMVNIICIGLFLTGTILIVLHVVFTFCDIRRDQKEKDRKPL